MPHFVVEAFGRAISSPFALPGRAISPAEVLTLDSRDAIGVTQGEARLEQTSRRIGSYTVGPQGLRIAASDGLAFLCEQEGRAVRVEADARIRNSFIAGHLVANAIPAALWMQGERLLHAGAFRLPGLSSAVLIAGDSGAGKSTVLAQMVDEGALLIAEDACTLRMEGEQVHVSGFSAQIQLSHGGEAEHRCAVAVPAEQQLPTGIAATLVVLETNSAREQVAPLGLQGIEKLQALLRHRYRSVVSTLLGRDPEDLRWWAEYADCLSVYSWNPRLVARAEWSTVLSSGMPADRRGWW